jgi:hypothetical protein
VRRTNIFVTQIMKKYIGNQGQTTPAPQQHIIDDEDDYVEVTGVDEDVEDGWEEIMVVNSPQARKVDNTIHNTTSNTSTPTTTTVTPVIVLPQSTQPIPINKNVIENNNYNVTKEVLVERVSSVQSLPKEAPQDPEWLATLKANGKVPYSASSLGVPQYVAPLGM